MHLKCFVVGHEGPEKLFFAMVNKTLGPLDKKQKFCFLSRTKSKRFAFCLKVERTADEPSSSEYAKPYSAYKKRRCAMVDV
jgi:hypothetical protein